MKIVIVTGPFLSVPPAICGAVERRWLDMAKEFAAMGHEVALLSSFASINDEGNSTGNLRIVRTGGAKSSGNVYWNLVRDYFYARKKEKEIPACDVLITNTFCLPLFSKKLKKKARLILPNIARMPKGQIGKYRKAGVDGLLAVSNAIKCAIIKEDSESEKLIHVVPNPVNLDAFKISSIERKPNSILFTGRIHPEKGLELLIDAFRIYHGKNVQATLKILGPHQVEKGGGGEGYLGKLKEIAKGLPIEFHAAIYERDEFAKVLCGADIFCYPSLAEKGESFGIAPLEAMACGTVPVLSSLDCFRDFATDGENSFFFDHRAADPVQALANRLLKAFSERDALSRMRKSAIERAQEFSNKRVAEKYIGLFDNLLKTD